MEHGLVKSHGVVTFLCLRGFILNLFGLVYRPAGDIDNLSGNVTRPLFVTIHSGNISRMVFIRTLIATRLNRLLQMLLDRNGNTSPLRRCQVAAVQIRTVDIGQGFLCRSVELPR